jgi:dolichol-phosphate mannosyltransferase
MKKLVLIIPTYNEVENIPPLLAVFDSVVKKLPQNWQLQLLFVDDNSPDGTADAVKMAQQQRLTKKTGLRGKQIHLYSNPYKQGLGKAYLVGMEYAFAHLSPNVLGQFDADLSHDPSKLPLMITQIEAGYGMVIGSRYIAGGSIPTNWSWYRKLLSYVGNNVVKFGLGHPRLADWTTGYRLFTKRVYQQIRPYITEEQFFGYLIMIGMTHAAVKVGTKIAEVPFAFVDRRYGESKLGIDYIFNTLIYVVWQRLARQLGKGKKLTKVVQAATE